MLSRHVAPDSLDPGPERLTTTQHWTAEQLGLDSTYSAETISIRGDGAPTWSAVFSTVKDQSAGQCVKIAICAEPRRMILTQLMRVRTD